jgi:hypothetical protein
MRRRRKRKSRTDVSIRKGTGFGALFFCVIWLVVEFLVVTIFAARNGATTYGS